MACKAQKQRILEVEGISDIVWSKFPSNAGIAIQHFSQIVLLPLLRRVPRSWSLSKFGLTLYIYLPLLPPHPISSSEAGFFLAPSSYTFVLTSISVAICYAEGPPIPFPVLRSTHHSKPSLNVIFHDPSHDFFFLTPIAFTASTEFHAYLPYAC